MKLFEPITIRKTVFKNRILMAGMGTGLGIRNENSRRHYEERARGGAGAIVFAGMLPDALTDDKFAQQFYEWVGAPVQKFGTKIGPELWYGNQYPSFWGKGIMPEYVAPSPGFPAGAKAMLSFFNDTQCYCRELTIVEIKDVIKTYVAAAVKTKEIGFDFVEMHGCHGHNLAHQFFSPLDNRRTDEYGGDIHGRMRFDLEIARGIREAIGDDFPFFWRLCAEEGLPGGYTLEECVTFCKELENAGVDVIDVSFGHEGIDETAPIAPMAPCPLEDMPVATFVPYAEIIKRNVKIPVIGVGRINTPELAESVLAEGKVDFVAVGRQFLADPHWPNKVKEGRTNEVLPCLSCNTCLYTYLEGHSIRCAVNATLGKEHDLVLEKATKSKKVMIIGGGPAGMEAARQATLRGHKVVLYEKGHKLGGQLIVGCAPPHKSLIEKYRKFQENELNRLGVAIIYNTDITPSKFKEVVAEQSPDAMILAAGASPVRPLGIKGIDDKKVVNAEDILAGQKVAGHDIVIIGGGQVGCEVALLLAGENRKITIIEMMDKMLPAMLYRPRHYMLYKLAEKSVVMHTSTACDSVDESGISINRRGRKYKIPADCVVLATGYKSNKVLEAFLREKFSDVQVIGDCISPRVIADAVYEGWQAAAKL